MSLNEEINFVLLEKSTKKVKREKLLNLGLTRYEVRMLLASLPTKPGKHTVGVEIECYNAGRTLYELTEIARLEGLQLNREEYNHEDHYDETFKAVRDASIDGSGAIEIVSPVICNDDKGFALLKKACKVLNLAGAKVNKSCGLHVHIGAGAMSDQQYINIFENYRMLELVIDKFMAQSRRADRNFYGKSLLSYEFNLCRTKEDVSNFLGCRYYKINPLAFERHNTIEFRQHQGTIDYTKIKHWVNFLIKLVDYSKNNRLSINERITEISQIPFLNKQEKAYYESRARHFNSVNN